MVRARIHLICGNCGSNDEWKWEYLPQENQEPSTVWLWCENCGTLHDISDNAKEIEHKAKNK